MEKCDVRECNNDWLKEYRYGLVCEECYAEYERVGWDQFSVDWKVERREKERRLKQKILEQQILELRREKVRREKERREKERRLEQQILEMKILREMGVPRKVINFLQENADFRPKNEEAIKKSFERGEIPLGFHDKLLWRKTANLFNELPTTMKCEEVRLEKLAKEERLAKQRLREIEEKRRQLVKEIANSQTQQKEIEAKLEPYQQILASGYGNIAQFLAQPEEDLAVATKTQFETNFYDFAAIDDDAASSPKLSLVFNTFGLSKNLIAKIGDFDGYEFLDSEISVLCNQVGLTNFSEAKQLVYIQYMAKNGVFLGGQHEEDCPVCSATTAEDFQYLVEEHVASNEDVRVCAPQLIKLGINGRAFLALTPQDLSSHLKISDKDFRRSYSKAKRYFERFHQEATME